MSEKKVGLIFIAPSIVTLLIVIGWATYFFIFSQPSRSFNYWRRDEI